MLCSENVTQVRQPHTVLSSTPRGLVKLYLRSSIASFFILYTSLDNFLPFCPLESTDALSEWRTASAMTVLQAMGLPASACRSNARLPVGQKCFGTGGRRSAPAPGTICFKVREKNFATPVCLSVGRRVDGVWRQFIAPRAGDARE
jgi:hypothetical protein